MGAHALGEFRIAVRSCCDWAWVCWPPFGSRCAQALWAAWNWELLTPSCCRLTLGNPLANSLLLSGSGNFGTPWERMQWEKAYRLESAVWEFDWPSRI